MKAHPCNRFFWLLIFLTVSSLSFAQELKKIGVHVKGATVFAYSPDNHSFVIGKGNRILVYSAGTNTKLSELSGHTKDVVAIAFNKQGNLLVTGSADKQVKIWSIADGKLLSTFTNSSPVAAVAFSDNENLVISVSEDGTLQTWNRETNSVSYTKRDFKKPIRAFASTYDGKHFAVGGGDKFILVYESATGNIVKKLEKHQDWVRSLAFSPDGKMLASGGDDKVIYLWNIQDGNVLKEIKQQGWIYDLEFSSDGRYLAAALEKNAIHFYNTTSGVLSLKLDLKFPVLKLAMSATGQEVASTEEFGAEIILWNISSLNIIPVYNFKDTKDSTPPLILVSNPPNIIDNKVVIYKDLIDVRGVVTDESGVRTLKVNGIPTPLKQNGNFVINIPLAVGDNFINIEVTDVNDNIALKKFDIIRKNMEGEAYNGSLAVNHLFVVGINDYLSWPHLNNAVKDANDVVSVFLRKYNFEFTNVTFLKDEQATRSNIYNKLRSLIEKVGPHDNLVIYFSGHGYFDQVLNEGYWIPSEANLNSTGDYVSNSDILKILNAINSQHTFLIADACFSGALFSDSRRGYPDQVEKFKSRWGLASGRLETVSDGTIGDNSPFAKRVIQFLNENEKEKCAISELVQFVKTHVAEDSDQTPIGNPLKALGDEGGEMVLYKRKI